MSRFGSARVRAIALTVAAAVLTALAGVPAVGTSVASAAEVDRPVLTSFSVSDTVVTAGSPTTISYAVTSDSALASVKFTYSNGGRYYAAQTGARPPLSGTVALTIPDGAPNGTWRLLGIHVMTSSTVGRTYARGGNVILRPVAPSEQHTFDFSLADVVVSGSTEDHSAPVVTSVVAASADVVPGQQVVGSYTLTEQTRVDHIIIWAREARTGHLVNAAKYYSDTSPRDGVVTFVVDNTWANGQYAISTVEVLDVMGNQATYRADGIVTDKIGASIGIHDLALGALQFSVDGSTADYEPPVLTRWSVQDRTVATGQPLTVAYAFDERQPRLTSVTAVWTIAGVGQVEMQGSDLPTSGTLSTTSKLSGIAKLEWITVNQGQNFATYLRDGTLYAGQQPTSTHAIDFSAQDVAMGGARPPASVKADPANGSAWVSWSVPTNEPPVTGWTVSATPGGQVKKLAASARSASFAGLTNGTSYTFSVVATDSYGPRAAGTASAMPRPFSRISGIGDFNGDLRNDVVAADRSGALWLYKGNGRGGFLTPRVRIGGRWDTTRVITPTNGPLVPKVAEYSPDLSGIRYDGTQVKYVASGRGSWQRSVVVPGSWSGASRVLGVGDWTGDGQPDLMSVSDGGALRLHRATGYSSYGSATTIGSGWAGLRQVFAAGDFSGDLRPDVMGVAPDGALYLYRGNGKGGWSGTKSKIGSGWQSFGTVFSPGDFTGDGHADVIAVTTSGDMYLYRGNGKGGWSGTKSKIGSGWNIFL